MTDSAPEEQYKPWGHWKRAPQWMRTIFLGEGPIFNLLKEIERWRGLTDAQREAIRQSVPNEIERRLKTLGDMKELIKACLAVVAFLSAEVIFVFTKNPQGFAAVLALILAGSHVLAVTTLLRAAIPPPHTLFTSFEHPFEWAKGGERRWTNDPDEQFLAQSYSYLLDLNHLVSFTKRCLVWASIVAGLGQLAFFAFLWVSI